MNRETCRQTENIVIAREITKSRLYRLLRKAGHITIVNQECNGHLKEMKNDPVYFPRQIIVTRATK